MTHCGTRFGVRVNGKLQWFTDHQDAVTAERAQLGALYANAPKLGFKIVLAQTGRQRKAKTA